MLENNYLTLAFIQCKSEIIQILVNFCSLGLFEGNSKNAFKTVSSSIKPGLLLFLEIKVCKIKRRDHKTVR